MPPSSPGNLIERARPLLGTRVAIRVEHADAATAHALIDQAFDHIARIHRLMSVQTPDSPLSRLNREAAQRPVPLDGETWQVLRAAQSFSECSDGLFDATDTPGADWRDVELLPQRQVRFRRPLSLDLGGIAKGYAVDCAVQALRDRGVRRGCVNAGGDLRVFGPRAESVHLLSAANAAFLPVLEVHDAAVASSGGDGAHRHGVTRRVVDPRLRVSVVAPDCMTADALTKIVLADPGRAEALLPQYRAVAYLNDPLDPDNGGWRVLAARAGLS